MSTLGRKTRISVHQASINDLLKLHGLVLDELRDRKIVRSSNSPGGDYAEFLFQQAFKWELTANSNAGYDAVDKQGRRYQIKCRRMTRHNDSRQLSVFRQLERKKFDFIAGVLFDEGYAVRRAAIIPRELLVEPRVRFRKHVNGWLFWLRDDVWDLPGVKDVTAKLAKVAENI